MKTRYLIGLLLAVLVNVVAAASIPPAMLAQFQSMSLAEQQKLAKQYGVELPTEKNQVQKKYL